MATAREIKGRIRSVKNISQITRALEAVSASKVRRAQARVTASRAYAEKAWEILLNVQAAGGPGGPPLHPLLEERETINNIMIVLITSDRGLAGAFNTNIIRVARRFAERLGKPVQWVTVGRKGRDSMVRAGANVVAEFTYLPDNPTISDIAPIARLAIDAFLSHEVDDVYIAYTDFINTLTQRPVVLGWLPLVPHNIEDSVAAEYVKEVPNLTQTSSDYEYEPTPEAILEEIVPRFTELQLYQAMLESKASEHSARMVAMRNASDNASQLIDDLTLEYNKARQAAITAEILDIVGGTEALQDSIEKTASEIEANYTQQDNANGGSRRGKKGADDLTRIEGIGPKMSRALKAAGIDTFKKLAQTDEATLREAISAAGMRFAPSAPTWPEQAAFAARGDWDGLANFQETLVAGRRA
jgi:F-type H+-transporting ATPase subunit gamma